MTNVYSLLNSRIKGEKPSAATERSVAIPVSTPEVGMGTVLPSLNECSAGRSMLVKSEPQAKILPEKPHGISWGKWVDEDDISDAERSLREEAFAARRKAISEQFGLKSIAEEVQQKPSEPLLERIKRIKKSFSRKGSVYELLEEVDQERAAKKKVAEALRGGVDERLEAVKLRFNDAFMREFDRKCLKPEINANSRTSLVDGIKQTFNRTTKLIRGTLEQNRVEIKEAKKVKKLIYESYANTAKTVLDGLQDRFTSIKPLFENFGRKEWAKAFKVVI